MFNAENAAAIAAGEVTALEESSVGFVEKASGIKARYVVEKEGVLDIKRMVPRIPERPDDQRSIMCDMSVAASLRSRHWNGPGKHGGGCGHGIGCLQQFAARLSGDCDGSAGGALGLLYGYGLRHERGLLFWPPSGLQTAVSCGAKSGQARAVLVVNPEITSGHLNWRDRDCHFIFGDACTAILVERSDLATSAHQFEILGTRLKTQFSNNIRNNFGYLNRADESGVGKPDKLFRQQGRKVFKEVCPMAAEMIKDTVESSGVCEFPMWAIRYWLHQANLNMNLLIARMVLGRDAAPDEAPVILDTYANTSSAGSIIAFHKYQDDMPAVSSHGVICSFGAGYSIGCVVVKKI